MRNRPCSLLALAALLALAPACEEKTGTTLAFEAEPSGGAPELSLRLRSLTATRLELEVVGNGLNDLYGVAFRLAYLPASLRLVSVTAGDVWPGSAQVHGVEPSPGLTVAAVTLRGVATVGNVDDRVLAVVTLDVLGTGVTPVTLDPVKTGVAQADGTWVRGLGIRSGQLVRR